MEEFRFVPAVRLRHFLRLAIDGPSGSGKTFSALRMAMGLARVLQTKVACLDSERGTSSLYANRRILLDGGEEEVLEFDVLNLRPPYDPRRYQQACWAAAKQGYGVLIVDSLSHAWTGVGGVIDMKDAIAKASRSGNSFTAWRDVSPLHNDLVETLLDYPGHLICTMRTKTAYEVTEEEDSRGRKKTRIQKLGLAPVQRDGVEYEFTMTLDLSIDGHIATPGKDRTSLVDGEHFVCDAALGERIGLWLAEGNEPAPKELAPPPSTPASVPPADDPWGQPQEAPRAPTAASIWKKAQAHGMKPETWQKLASAVGLKKTDQTPTQLFAMDEEVDNWIAMAEQAAADTPADEAPIAEAPLDPPPEDGQPTPLDDDQVEQPAEEIGEAQGDPGAFADVAPAPDEEAPISKQQAGWLQRTLYSGVLGEQQAPVDWINQYLTRSIDQVEQLTAPEYDFLKQVLRAGRPTEVDDGPAPQPPKDSLEYQRQLEQAIATLLDVAKQTIDAKSDEQVLLVAKGICGLGESVKSLDQLDLNQVLRVLDKLDNRFGGKAKQQSLPVGGDR